MKISVRLMLTLALAAVIPIAVTGVLLVRSSRAALGDRVRAGQLAAAESIAQAADLWMDEVLARMRLSADLFDLTRMDAESQTGALRIVYRQFEDVDLVGLYRLDRSAVVPPVYLTAGDPETGRLPVNADEQATLEAALPLAAAKVSGVAVGMPYLVERKHTVMAPLAVRIGPEDAPWFLVAELALKPLQSLVARVSPEAVGTASVIDLESHIIAHPDGTRFMSELGQVSAESILSGGAGRVYEAGEGKEARLGAAAPLATIPWVAVVEQPRSQAFGAVEAMVQRTGIVVGVALLFAIVVGLFMSRGISGPMGRVAEGARAIAGGDLDQRLPEGGAAELDELARSFNQMTAELARSRAEIEAFNEQLQARVDERTRELKLAQAQLLQARKLAALGELGAGVAHELNNPLTGILGMAQLMLRKREEEDPEYRFLKRIEEDAKRCREITMNLLRFSEQGLDSNLTETPLSDVVSRALAMRRQLMEERGLTLEEKKDGEPPPILADAAQLQQALLNVIANAEQATPEGGRITVTTGREGAFAYVRIEDTGAGIPKGNLERVFEPFFTTKSDWRGAGLGLSVAYQIVEAHNGTLHLESVEGEGTRVTVRIPVPA